MGIFLVIFYIVVGIMFFSAWVGLFIINNSIQSLLSYVRIQNVLLKKIVNKDTTPSQENYFLNERAKQDDSFYKGVTPIE